MAKFDISTPLSKQLQALFPQTDVASVASALVQPTWKVPLKEPQNILPAAPVSSMIQQPQLPRYDQFNDIVDNASSTYGVPASLIKGVIHSESGGNPRAMNRSSGAKGTMQLIDSTFKWMGGKNPYDPEDNIMTGTKYLKYLLDKFNGNTDYAIAAYNAGPGNVHKYGGVPPFGQTQAYLKKVKNYMGQYK
jgi:soluble lytic murein transglycosylase-like protein